MDLDDLRTMLKVSRGKLLAACAVAPTQEVGDTLPTEALKSSYKRPSASIQQADDLARRHKKVKILSRRHKSRRGEGGLGLTPRVRSRRRRLKSLRRSLSKVEKLKNLTKIWSDLSAVEEFERGLLHPQLARELYTLPSDQEIDALKSGEGPEAVAAAEEHASKLEKELEKTKREQDEALQRLEISDKELNEA
ncbi:hypothetical protein B296_00058973 [Ensete ventricosum]|uniref:Uncharacterized protein n=1 Tax=Ensete ventricosum TaxID=4639 RepID=A0A426X4F1_ENSVE|nr:hypothetical protein B296_00058973 [Ensete ventricosum]